MSGFFYYFLFFFQGKIWGFSSQQSGNTYTVIHTLNMMKSFLPCILIVTMHALTPNITMIVTLIYFYSLTSNCMHV